MKERLYQRSKRGAKQLFSEDKLLIKNFVKNYLKEDGVLALRLLSRNSQDLIVSELISNLFFSYKEQQINNKKHAR